MLYVASYNELEQLAIHASVIKLSFGRFFVPSIHILKKRPNDNLITLACIANCSSSL